MTLASHHGGRRPNILLVSIDSLRADHVHCYGYGRETTPTIDALARDGALFRSTVSSTSWTVPAHMTLLTALPPEAHGVTRGNLRLGPGPVTLAQTLGTAGYATAAFVSGPTVRALYGFDRGFDRYDDRLVTDVDANLALRQITSPRLLTLFTDWLRGWDREGRKRPFFIFLHMFDVHFDYAPPKPYDTLFGADYVGGDDATRNGHPHGGMSPRDLEHMIALYDGEIRFTDEHLGRMVEALRELGVLDDTLIAVVSDHGDEFMEHAGMAHGRTLYDEVLLVPFVLRYPRKVPAGQAVAHQVRLMDVAPTILGVADVGAPPEFGGDVVPSGHRARDLSPWIVRGGAPTPFPELTAFSHLETLSTLAAVRTERHKLIQRLDADHGQELYELPADPGERHNLWPTDTGDPVPGALEAELGRWRSALAEHPPIVEPARFDDDARKRLRALGYVE